MDAFFGLGVGLRSRSLIGIAIRRLTLGTGRLSDGTDADQTGNLTQIVTYRNTGIFPGEQRIGLDEIVNIVRGELRASLGSADEGKGGDALGCLGGGGGVSHGISPWVLLHSV